MDNELDLIKENMQALTMINIRLYSQFTKMTPNFNFVWNNKHAEGIYNKNFEAIKWYNELIKRIEDEK